MTGWRSSFEIYTDRRVLGIVLLGFSSGLPLALTLSTLFAWLAKAGVHRTEISLFALAGLPYTLKFLWAPLFDGVRLPGLTARLGRRRGWAVAIQFLLALAILALGATDPRANPWATACCTLGVAFFSASQDVVLDAYRIELLEREQYGAGAAAYVFGYRMAMLTSGAGALVIADHFGWFGAYGAMAGLMAVGIATVLVLGEPSRPRAAPRLSEAVLAPLREFFTRRRWAAVLGVVILYKVGEAVGMFMANPLFIALGFSLSEIAAVSKGIGMVATILGGFAGGIAVARFGILRALLLCGVLQTLGLFCFAFQALAGHDIRILAATVGAANFTDGMASAAFVAYLSGLCRPGFAATQYALLSALAVIGRTLFGSASGWIADHVHWTSFFLLSMAAALPGMLLLLWIMRRRPDGDILEGGLAAP